MESSVQEVPVWGKSLADFVAPYGVLAIDCLCYGDGHVEWCYGRCGDPNTSTSLQPLTEARFKEMVGQAEFDSVQLRMLGEYENWKIQQQVEKGEVAE